MPVRWGKVVSRADDIRDDVISGNKIESGLTVQRILAFFTNTSSSSGGATAVTFPVDHNLNVSPRIYGATLLSHASAGSVTVTIGRLNQSQMEIHLMGTRVSGDNAANVVSGLFVHAHAIG